MKELVRDHSQNIPVQTSMAEKMGANNNIKIHGLYRKKKLYPIPFPTHMFNNLENVVPETPKKTELTSQKLKCQGGLCNEPITNTIQLKKNNSEKSPETISEKALSLLAGIRFNLYHLVYYLIKELEFQLSRREREKKCFHRYVIRNSRIVKLYRRNASTLKKLNCYRYVL